MSYQVCKKKQAKAKATKVTPLVPTPAPIKVVPQVVVPTPTPVVPTPAPTPVAPPAPVVVEAPVPAPETPDLLKIELIPEE